MTNLRWRMSDHHRFRFRARFRVQPLLDATLDCVIDAIPSIIVVGGRTWW
jgi:hypothetical protein